MILDLNILSSMMQKSLVPNQDFLTKVKIRIYSGINLPYITDYQLIEKIEHINCA